MTPTMDVGKKVAFILVPILFICVSVDAWDKGVPVELRDGDWRDILKGEWLLKLYVET